ncbi:MAG: hypothetical protein CL609_18095 [Anaerolineaceae bacterium]|nr:hypothetical protein [Anaerolineaceae bacterium]
MDRIKPDFLDEIMEDAFTSEPMAPTPPGFTKMVMDQIQIETVTGFQIFSLLDLILSLGAAFTFGLVISLPLLVPEQLQPWIVWLVQWVFYTMEKSLVSWPLWLFLAGGILLVGLLLIVFQKEVASSLHAFKKLQNQER